MAGNFDGIYPIPLTDMAPWFFQLSFAATATTIISGMIAERGEVVPYVITSFFITTCVYPIASHWIWDPNGWLYKAGFFDFADARKQFVQL